MSQDACSLRDLPFSPTQAPKSVELTYDLTPLVQSFWGRKLSTGSGFPSCPAPPVSHTETAPPVLPLTRNCPLLGKRGEACWHAVITWGSNPSRSGAGTLQVGSGIPGGIKALGRKDPQSLTGPDQSRCADWWSLHDSGTTVDAQAAGDPSTEARHPKDKEQEPRIVSTLHSPTPNTCLLPSSFISTPLAGLIFFSHAHLPTQHRLHPHSCLLPPCFGISEHDPYLTGS